jgi:hypothetical protein
MSEPASVDVVTFKGVKFRRYPDAKQWADRAYFTPGIADRQRGVQRLHQEVWKDANGSIPDGWDVHHKDGDMLNNDPGNLECLPEPEHLAHHAAELTEEQRLARREWIEAIRPLAAAWHASEEGRAWHSEHAKQGWENREPVRKTCDHCHAEFLSFTRRADDRFCSNNCKSAWRRSAGVDNVFRACGFCGNQFAVNKYSKARCCSGVCAWGVRRQKAAASVQSDGRRTA